MTHKNDSKGLTKKDMTDVLGEIFEKILVPFFEKYAGKEKMNEIRMGLLKKGYKVRISNLDL